MPDLLVSDLVDALNSTSTYRLKPSRIATLIIPHDTQRDAHVPSPADDAALAVTDDGTAEVEDLGAMLDAAATALRSGDKAAIYVGGAGLWKGQGLETAGLIADTTGCDIICDNAFARVDRGAGLPNVIRLPYFPADALAEMQRHETIVFIGARVPVAMFGYEDGISQLADPTKQRLIMIDTHDVAGALGNLANLVGAGPDIGNISLGAPPPGAIKRPRVPTGKLTATKLCAAIAYAQPEGAIIVDESLTSGGPYWNNSVDCPPFSHLTLTGGAIGNGPPLALGCAVACPDRQVINFQADGSGMYSLQALWTQAREKLNVITVICNNSKYNILKIEQQKQKLKTKGAATLSLTDLGDPPINWVSLANGMGVEAVRVDTAEALLEHLEAAINR